MNDAGDTRILPAAQALLETERLPFPRLPAHLCASLRAHGPRVFASRPLPASPYELERFLAEVEADPALPAYAVIGFDGHGINSWAVHWYLVDDAIALFVQLPWGGAYLDPEAARAEIADLFDWGGRLQSKLQLASQQQKVPRGWRLQVAASRFGRAGWRWLVPARDNAATPWNPPAGMKAALQALLDDVLEGRRVL